MRPSAAADRPVWLVRLAQPCSLQEMTGESRAPLLGVRVPMCDAIACRVRGDLLSC